MKILQMHVDFIEYEPVKKEIAAAEEAERKRVREEEAVVLFTAVEKGDDEELARKAAKEAAEFVSRLGVRKVMVYPFAHISQNLASPADAIRILSALKEEAVRAGLSVSSAPFGWTKALQVKVKGHPLAEMSRSYSHGKVQESVVTARKGERRDQRDLLSRMKKVDHSGLPETDHRVIGEKLDLFSFYEPSPSMPYWHEKGIVLKNTLIEAIRREIKKRGYTEIGTALMANVDLWKVSGHWEHYKDNMFLTKLKEGEEETFGLKPMNCPSTILYYLSRRWSYRDLPLRIADFDLLHRKELSGVVTGLFRVKSFIQDDAHIFCTEEQVGEELRALIDLVDYFYGIFRLEYTARISTMPDEHLGTEEQWKEATEILIEAVRAKGIKPVIKEREGAFYGPKIDVDVKDSLGREWQCATIQLDFQLPQRFQLSYIGPDGRERTPVIIHRVIYGSLERFIGIILEHYQGRLPFWLSPVQAVVIPVSDESREYGEKILAKLAGAGIRAEGDFEPGTVNAKIRNAQLLKVPVMIVVGEREEESDTISIRERDGTRKSGITVDEFLKEARERISSFS